MYICVCKAVTDSQIVSAIESGLCTRKKLTHCLGLGKDCGKCNQHVNAIIQQYHPLIAETMCLKNAGLAKNDILVQDSPIRNHVHFINNNGCLP